MWGSAFELDGAAVADARMEPAAVVEDLDELEHGGARGGPSREPVPVHELALERCEEALRGSVVQCVADRSHRPGDAGCTHAAGEGQSDVLGTLVGVMD